MTTTERLFDATRAFDHPLTIVATIAIVFGLVFGVRANSDFASTQKGIRRNLY